MTMDARIVTSAQRGDERAFAIIVEAVSGRFLGVAHRILHDAQLAEDATQLAFVRMWRHLPGLRDADRFEAWGYRLLVKACYTEAKRHRRWRSDASLGLADPATGPDGITDIVARDELEQALRRLSVEHRAVLVLRYYVDLPVDEIAIALEIPPGTVKSRLHRAHEALRGALEADDRFVAVPVPSRATR
jgi:RNA polymerase sigma-70 factor (ECF subfamily)